MWLLLLCTDFSRGRVSSWVGDILWLSVLAGHSCSIHPKAAAGETLVLLFWRTGIVWWRLGPLGPLGRMALILWGLCGTDPVTESCFFVE